MQKSPWPWPEMEVNDSIFFPAERGEDAISIRKRVRTHVWVKHGGKLGLRVGRTK